MANVSWIFGATGDWSTAANWVTGTVPTSADDTSLDSVPSGAATITGAAEANSLALDSSYLTDGGTLTLGTALTMTNGSYLYLDGGTVDAPSGISFEDDTALDHVVNSGGSSSIAGDVGGHGEVDINGGSLAVSGSINDWYVYVNSGSMTVAGSVNDVITNVYGSLTVGGLMDGFLTHVYNSGSLTVDGSLSGAAAIVDSGGSMTVDGSVSVGIVVNVSGSMTVGGALNTGNSSSHVSGSLTVGGALTGGEVDIVGGSLEIGGASSSPIVFSSGGGTLRLDAPAEFTGAITVSGTTPTLDLAGVAVGAVSYDGSTLTVTESNNQQLTFSVSGRYDLSVDAVTFRSDGNGGTDINWAPTVAVTTSNDVNLAQSTATITFSFSVAPSDFSLEHVSAVGGTLSDLQRVDATTYTALFTGAESTDISNAGVTVDNAWHDRYGSVGATGVTAPFVVDTVSPTVAVSIDGSNLTLSKRAGTVTFSFSEAPVSFTLADTTAIGGSLGNLQKVNATTYTATFTAAANTLINNASVGVVANSWQEDNGNPGAGDTTANFSVDTLDHWTNAAGGSWTTASNWGNGVPAAAVAADIDRTGTYAVTISGVSSAYGLLVNDAGAIVSDSKNGALTLAGQGGSNSALTISAGTFALAGGILAAGSISIASGGALQISQSYTGTAALAEAITNNGAITLASPTGQSSFAVSFNGTLGGSGTVTVQGGATAVIGKAVSGTGSFTLMKNGSLELVAADSENVTFASGSTGTLKLDHSLTAPFAGKISGLTPKNAIDLADLAYLKPKSMIVTYTGNATGGVLTVSNGTQNVSLDLLGDYTHSTWTLSKDASGGTLVVDPPDQTPKLDPDLVPSSALDLLQDTLWAHSALGLAGYSDDIRDTLASADAPYGPNLALLVNYMASGFPLSSDGYGHSLVSGSVADGNNQHMLLSLPQHG
ncbi:hypothetical protein FJ960_09200 [Mesorhizobium sp. B2-3-11]|uniref:beta strand repeat-containing protein n=1 Tax=Mesorhizobium sp. B2-3-11 TaxID=2589953 RepID=UPI001127205C|nr:Ig-like domain-containing protein [Mesorhizobium sp. B2-3-11]TPM07083.1 hypothetical protein FJ960_09200 [Mesorhizobium sp. B2-3-11]